MRVGEAIGTLVRDVPSQADIFILDIQRAASRSQSLSPKNQGTSKLLGSTLYMDVSHTLPLGNQLSG